jgi:polysaccharide biosynthesis protein PslH
MKRMIIVASRFPYPLEKGDKLRLFNQIKDLSEKFEIHLFAITHQNPPKSHSDALSPYCKSIRIYKIPTLTRIFNVLLRLFSQLPLKVSYFYSSKVHKRCSTDANQIQPDLLYCQLIRTTEYAKNIQCPIKVIDFMDCFSEGELLAQNYSSSIIGKVIGKLDYQKTRRYEATSFELFNRHTIISAKDKRAFPHKDRDKIMVTSNGVDMNEFYPLQVPKKYDLLFSGNLHYQPNIDAAKFLIKEIFPIIERSLPEVKLLVAGIGAEHSLKGFARENIQLISHFNHIREAFSQSRINLVPVISSIGLQNKILQAMAMHMPTITTPSAALGLGLDEKTPLLIVASSPEQFAHETIELLKNEERQRQLAELGTQYIRSQGSWQKQNELLISLFAS